MSKYQVWRDEEDQTWCITRVADRCNFWVGFGDQLHVGELYEGFLHVDNVHPTTYSTAKLCIELDTFEEAKNYIRVDALLEN